MLILKINWNSMIYYVCRVVFGDFVTYNKPIGYLTIDTFWLTELGEYSLSLWGSAGEVRAKQRHASAATVALNIASSVINNK